MIKVLDKGYVRLVDSMGSDLSIVRSARVSHNAEWRTGENEKNDTKLINYLWKNRHTTPFESVTFTFEVKAPIFVFRQWHRHRTWSYNEVSARYTELPEEFYVPVPSEIGNQSKLNKQARELEELPTEVWKERMHEIDKYNQFCTAAFAEYKYLLQKGWPRELARAVLPVSTYSHMFATVNLGNLFKFLELRLHSHAQYEIRVYADAMLTIAQTITPVACDAFLSTLKQ